MKKSKITKKGQKSHGKVKKLNEKSQKVSYTFFTIEQQTTVVTKKTHTHTHTTKFMDISCKNAFLLKKTEPELGENPKNGQLTPFL